jgi:hypothetical protein
VTTASSSRSTRPPLGELTVGQQVMVARSSNDMRGRKPEDRYIPAVVIKAARVWIELQRAGLAEKQLGYRTWRMRRDTQDEGTQYSGNNDRFLTLEQHAWEETRNWALGVLAENGIDLRHGSAWCGREIELADMITARKEEEEVR